VVGVTPLGALLWTAACHGLFQLAAYAVSVLRGTPDLVTLGSVQALVYLSSIWVMLRTYEASTPLRQSLGLRPTDQGLGLLGVGLGVCLQLPAESVTRVVERFFPPDDAQLLARAALYRTETVADILAMLLTLCVAAPLVEELFFRGASFGRLVKNGPRLAALISGVTFVVVHPDPRHWPALLVVAAVLSYLRFASGSLLPCIGLHVAFNATGVLSLVTGAASMTRPLDVPVVAMLSSWAVAIGLMMMLVRLSQNPEALRARAEDQA
jgi:membrane protease YdiL (CAAX protease family)